MYTANDLLAIALGEKGYLEKNSNSNLDSKTANAGSKNYTKYARDLYAAGYYQANKQGVAWCDMFHDWCHYIAAKKNAKLAQEIICQSGPYGASCQCSMNYYKEAGRFYTSNPEPGDQIFFGSKSNATHTGIVTEIKNGRVYTVEGNTSSASGVVANGGGVFEKSYSLNYTKIAGYGRPRYKTGTGTTVKPNTNTSKEVCNVELNILRKGDKGEQVKALQLLLIGNDCSCGERGADGDFGSKTVSAVKKYQKKKGLEPDGVVGPATWGALLGAK